MRLADPEAGSLRIVEIACCLQEKNISSYHSESLKFCNGISGIFASLQKESQRNSFAETSVICKSEKSEILIEKCMDFRRVVV